MADTSAYEEEWQ